MFDTLLLSLLVVSALMVGLWMISVVRRDAGIVDPFWGTGFVVVAWLVTAGNWPVSTRMLLVAILTTVWGLRLSFFLLFRNMGLGEDSRYAAMRSRHGEKFWWVSLFTVFLLQALILWFVSFPILAVSIDTEVSQLNWLDLVGVVVWSIGIFFEAVGDWQLHRFKSRPENQGQVLDTGLWRYTRHPNYFGDFCIWWGIYIVSISGGAAWTIGSPILMSFFLMKVSGVALLEKTIVDRRPKYAEYIQNTNAFFPGIKRGRRLV